MGGLAQMPPHAGTHSRLDREHIPATKYSAILAILVAAGAGAVVWGMSPVLTGSTEPWDAEFPFYVVALVVAGLGAGMVAPKPLWAHYVGSVVGQMGYEVLFLDIGPLFVLGVVFLLGYGFFFLIGASVGAQVRVQLNERIKS
jgi:hypothetical protein